MPATKPTRLLALATITSATLLGLTGCTGDSATDQSAPDKAALAYFANLQNDDVAGAYSTLHMSLAGTVRKADLAAAQKIRDVAGKTTYADATVTDEQETGNTATVAVKVAVNGKNETDKLQLIKGGPSGDKWYVANVNWQRADQIKSAKLISGGKTQLYKSQLLTPGVYKFQMNDNPKVYVPRTNVADVDYSGSISYKITDYTAAKNIAATYALVAKQTLQYCATNNTADVVDSSDVTTVGVNTNCPSWDDINHLSGQSHLLDSINGSSNTDDNFVGHQAFKVVSEPQVSSVDVDPKSGAVTVNLTGGSYQLWQIVGGGGDSDSYQFGWGSTLTFDGSTIGYGGADDGTTPANPLDVENAVFAPANA